jgi:hypothetical protein
LSISYHYSTCLSSRFSISFHYFLPYFPNLFTIFFVFFISCHNFLLYFPNPTTIRLAFLPYFPYHFTIFFHISHIFSLFN